MPQRQPDNLADLTYGVDLALQGVADEPNNVVKHQALRNAALRYKAGGGKAAGILERLGIHRRDPLGRLLQVERLWSLDAGNLDYVPQVFAAVAGVDRCTPSPGFAAVRRWLYDILAAGGAGA
jgi:hypothetical protein